MGKRDATSYQGPLERVRVLDLTRVLAGPYATSLLADLGADVIKIEDIRIGDTSRLTPPFLNGVSSHFVNLNRNKRSAAINLKHQEGRLAFLQMVRNSDIVIENFRPGTLARLGLGYDDLRTVNPAIILCSISGFGQTGPYSQLPSYDVITQALSGAMSVTGEPGRPPVRLGIPMGDLSGALFGAIAVLAALHERDVTGQGQALDVSMLDGLASLMLYYPLDYLNTRTVAGPVGGRHEHIAPYGVFEVADGHMVLALFDNKFWRMYCEAAGRPELATDPRFHKAPDRLANRSELYPILEEIMKRRGRDDWTQLFTAAGIPHAPILSVDEVAEHPLMRERQMFIKVEDDLAGEVFVAGRPIKLMSREQQGPTHAPSLGEQTRALLMTIANYSGEHVDRLLAEGIIYQGGPPPPSPPSQ